MNHEEGLVKSKKISMDGNTYAMDFFQKTMRLIEKISKIKDGAFLNWLWLKKPMESCNGITIVRTPKGYRIGKYFPLHTLYLDSDATPKAEYNSAPNLSRIEKFKKQFMKDYIEDCMAFYYMLEGISGITVD